MGFRKGLGWGCELANKDTVVAPGAVFVKSEGGRCWGSYYVQRQKDLDQEQQECEVVVVGIAVVSVRRWECQP